MKVRRMPIVKRILFMFIGFYFLMINSEALTINNCDVSEISKLKAQINNINISYDYYIDDSPVFSVTINNVVPGVYFVDSSSNITYYYGNTNNGEITIGGYRDIKKGKYSFYAENCNSAFLGSKYYKFPTYNPYYNDPICYGISLSICNKWSENTYSKDQIEKQIAEYKKWQKSNETVKETVGRTLLDDLLDLYVKYYYYILSLIIVVCLVIIAIEKRKNKFNFKT